VGPSIVETRDAQHIELGLGKPAAASVVTEPAAGRPPEPKLIGADRPAKAKGTGLTLFVDRLLGVLSAHAPEAAPETLNDFRQHLQFCRREIAAIPPEPGLGATLEACLKRLEAHLNDSQQYHLDREGELTEVIAILREAATLMAGDSSQFHEQMLTRSDRVGSLVQLEDLKEIRRQVSTELTEIRRAITDKQKRDEAAQEKLTHRVQALQTKLAKVEEEATHDPLTGVRNRGAFDRTLARMVAAAGREGVPLSLAILDLDNFKQINDQHGHPVGDRVLIATAQWIANAVRHTDFVARYGGEEFAVIFHDAALAPAERRMREALEGLSKTKFEYMKSPEEAMIVRWTASCGVTQMFGGESLESLVKRADEALYEAKRKGKNRVVTKKRSIFAGLTARP
jgi:diguanylate cyclase (GGDEF)-like protein